MVACGFRAPSLNGFKINSETNTVAQLTAFKTVRSYGLTDGKRSTFVSVFFTAITGRGRPIISLIRYFAFL